MNPCIGFVVVVVFALLLAVWITPDKGADP